MESKGTCCDIALQLAEEEGLEVVHGHVIFVGRDPGAATVEAELAVFPTAGPPARWGVTLCEAQSQACEALGAIRCGASFDLEVEALDRLGNRYSRNQILLLR